MKRVCSYYEDGLLHVVVFNENGTLFEHWVGEVDDYGYPIWDDGVPNKR